MLVIRLIVFTQNAVQQLRETNATDLGVNHAYQYKRCGPKCDGQSQQDQSSTIEYFENISSGLRINNAADDAAGLAVAENLDAEHQSLRPAHRNTNDGISVI